MNIRVCVCFCFVFCFFFANSSVSLYLYILGRGSWCEGRCMVLEKGKTKGRVLFFF